MYEGVGRRHLPGYFAKVHALTRPGGLFLLHGITITARGAPAGVLDWAWRRLWREGAFIRRYVFPGGYLPSLPEALGLAERAGFETRDVESLREHYVLTLRAWGRRLAARRDEAVRLVGESAFRLWRLYMAFASHEFATGTQGLVQVLLARPDAQGRCQLPLTRADLYQSPVGGGP
jgi:cyclopropane-fatty-acyl-phospholipid synthase